MKKLPEISSLSIEEKVGQLFVIGIPGVYVDPETGSLLDSTLPGGICLFARNIKEAEETRLLTDELAGRLPIRAILCLDQEGGPVDRLRRLLNPMPAASEMLSEDNVRDLARIIAESMRMLGFNLDFAPVVDVVDEERLRFSNGLRSRTFGRSSNEVISLARTFLEEMENGGVATCLKHFPGLGAAEVDSHEELPVVGVDDKTFFDVDLAPYSELLSKTKVGTVMVAHAAYPAINLQETDQNGRLLPSSLSFNFVNTLLRKRLAFNGVAITDDLEMGAIVKNYGIGDACKRAISAGIDMLAICASADAIKEGHAALLEAVYSGEIPESRIDESLSRIFALKDRLAPPLSLDLARLSALSDEIALLKKRLI